MLPAPSLDDLARRVRSRCDDSGGPYVLFLGAGCAAAAGAPPTEIIARDLLKTFGYDTTPASPDEPFEHVLSRFAEHTDKLSRSQLTRMVRSVYAKVPVPSFYQDLALMVRERFFPIIVTTNFDTLLELALESVGLRNSDYLLTTLGPRSRSESAPSRNLRPGSSPLTHIIKLHGDLAHDTGYLTPSEIEQALSASRQWIKADLSADLIMVGHSPGEGPIDGWLAHAPQRELWWISGTDGSPPDLAVWSNDVHVLSGDLARPQIFFQQLALRLLRAPEASESGATAGDTAPEVDAGLESVRSMAPAVPESDSLVDTLQREILRSQSMLTSLSQEALPGTRSPETQAQIQYQKKRLSSLEDRLRLLPDVKLRLVDLVDRILASIRGVDSSRMASAGFDGVAAYLERETETLKRELGADTPNQSIVSAALGATLTVADRLYTELGESVVNVDDLRALAALVPTSSGRVVVP
jgi:hypothetical protein